MKKIIFKSRHFVVAFMLIAASLYIVGCQSEDITAEDDIQIESAEKLIPPPNPFPDVVCVVRLAYLSYLERCPESTSVINYWLGVLAREDFGGLAVGFISSPEANQRWTHRYNAFLHRNNITSSNIAKKVYIAYRGLLLREPDVSGGIYWTNILNTQGLLAVANGIGDSAEFARRRANFPTECSNAANQCPF